MGLGGLTRDSIIGLNNLVHDDDDTPCHSRTHSGGNTFSARGSWNNGPTNEKSDDYLFLEDDAVALPLSESHASFETSLNDGLSPSTSPAPRTFPRSKNTTTYDKVSATNTRSLDSYRQNKGIDSSGQNGAQAAHYQGLQYEGYADYYSDDFASYNDSYGYSMGNESGEEKNIFCCLFAPWAQPKAIETEVQSATPALEEEQVHAKEDSGVSSFPENKTGSKPSGSSSEDAKKIPNLTQTPAEDSKATNPSDETPPKKKVSGSIAAPVHTTKTTMPQVMSDGLSDSASTDNTSCSYDEKKQEDGDSGVGNTFSVGEVDELDGFPAAIKSILKVKRCSASINTISKRKSIQKPINEVTSASDNKRHLFPTYEPKKSQTSDPVSSGKAINFNPMARVLSISSRKDIPFHQKAQVWWQKSDYDEFKKTGRIISKAMECGGSEIWLASSNAWGNRAAQSQKMKIKEESSGAQVKYGDSEEYNKALAKYVTKEDKKDDESGSNSTDEKWWCKFGHSRRGLEHIASSMEGRARQQAVMLAIRMVMEEQKRQRITRTKDPNKLRNVALQYTSWARDLSLAAGAADEEAVASGFNPTATCRAQHFAKRLATWNQNDAAGGVVMRAVTSSLLDANTHASSRTKKSSAKSVSNVSHSEESLRTRAKGFMPGESKAVPVSELKNVMGNVSARPTVQVS
mmetsp:Transcript_38755/g.83488  ORF Transcript_38755/g.83488 Transcript_38755/m.83488 type:complete len:687 (-) Transcript_38755:194-2254(-)